MPETQQEAEAVALACLLTGEDLEARGEVVRPLMASYQQVQELEDGYAFQFPGGAGMDPTGGDVRGRRESVLPLLYLRTAI